MTATQPIKPSIPDTEIGTTAQQAWNEQEALGWMNLAKGRICIKWGMAQELLLQNASRLQEEKILYCIYLDKEDGTSHG